MKLGLDRADDREGIGRTSILAVLDFFHCASEPCLDQGARSSSNRERPPAPFGGNLF